MNFTNAVEKRVGVFSKDASYIDGGCYANVYDLHNGTVLKITVDTSDAKAAKYISECYSKYMVGILDVFRIDEDNYGIVSEKALPLSDLEREFFDLLDTYGDDSGYPHIYLELFLDQASSTEKKTFHKELKWLNALIDELEDLGIEYNDLHSGNVMNDKDGNLILIDFGSSHNNWSNIKIPWV